MDIQFFKLKEQFNFKIINLFFQYPEFKIFNL